MSLGSQILVSGIFLLQTMWWVNGAAIQSSSPVPFTSRPPNMQMPMQRNNSDNPRNTTSLSPEDFKFFMPTEQTRREAPNPSAPVLPFGINPSMPQPPPQGFMMSPPPGFRPTQISQQFMTPPLGVMMQPPPNMNRPIQQGQSQPPRQEVPPMVNATTVHVPLVNSNVSRPNNNTRRETEQTTSTTTKPGTVTTRKPFQETPQGNDKQESDGSKMRQPQAPPNQFVAPHPMMMPFNPMMMNQPLFIDPMGRLMMLVPVPLDPSRSPLFAQANPQQAVPQGPPVPVSFQVTLGQLPVGTVSVMPDFSKQPPSPPRGDKNKNTSTTS